MRGIAFTGGEGPEPEVLKKLVPGADFLAAADSGLMLAERAGILPHAVIGDMDSLDDRGRLEKYPPGSVQIFPADKDFTDTELALNLLAEKGCDEIWIAGGGGGRLDHLLAVREIFERGKPPQRWYTAREEIRFLKEGDLLRGDVPGETVVSVLPLGKEPAEAESSGLKWPLDGIVWERGFAGVSNVALDGKFTVRAVKGRFMVIFPLFV